MRTAGVPPFRTAQFKHVLKLLARKRLGSRWAKYPFSRCWLCAGTATVVYVVYVMFMVNYVYGVLCWLFMFVVFVIFVDCAGTELVANQLGVETLS